MYAFRFYHLLFGGAVLLAWFTAEELGLVHAWTGYAVALLLTVRLLLGIARRKGFEFRRLFPRFVRSPAGQDGLRHPAVSRTLTLALLLAVAGTATTGILLDQGGTLVGKSIRDDDERQDGASGSRRDDEEHEVAALVAPGAERRAQFAMPSLIPPAYADSRERGEREGEEHGALGEVHETLGNLLLPLAVLHIIYLLAFRFELARFMLFAQRRRA